MTETDTATLTEPQIEAPVENDPQTPEDLEEQIASLRREIQMLREHDETVRERAEDCTRLTLEWEQSKKVTLSKKRALNEALDELRQLARGRPTYGELFDQAGKSNGQVEPADALDAGGAEVWRLTTLDTLGLKPTIIEKLANHEPPLTTMGQLSDYLADERHRLTDIAGIGEAAAAAIEDATAQYWAQHPEHCGQAQVAADDDAADPDEPGADDEGDDDEAE
jgi:regulator of replication initiation timing